MPLDHLTLLVIDPSSSRSRCRDTLTMAIRAQRPDIRTLKCICGILLHRIAAHNSDSGIVLVQLLADVVEAALPALETDSRRTLKVFLFGESYVLKSTLCNVDMPPNGTAGMLVFSPGCRLVLILCCSGFTAHQDAPRCSYKYGSRPCDVCVLILGCGNTEERDRQISRQCRCITYSN